MFANKARDYPSGAPFEMPPYRTGYGHSISIQTCLKGLPVSNTLAYALFITGGDEKFYKLP
jgi:hypothetical protein